MSHCWVGLPPADGRMLVAAAVSSRGDFHEIDVFGSGSDGSVPGCLANAIAAGARVEPALFKVPPSQFGWHHCSGRGFTFRTLGISPLRRASCSATRISHRHKVSRIRRILRTVRDVYPPGSDAAIDRACHSRYPAASDARCFPTPSFAADLDHMLQGRHWMPHATTSKDMDRGGSAFPKYRRQAFAPGPSRCETSCEKPLAGCADPVSACAASQIYSQGHQHLKICRY